MHYDDADGQKIAKKLSSQIKKESTVIRELLTEYNQADEDNFSPLLLEEALDPDSIGSRLGSCTEIATGERRELVDNYLLLCRSREEIKLLKEECQNLINYYQDMRMALKEEITRRSTSNFDRGAVSLCHKLCKKVDNFIAQGLGLSRVMNEQVESVLDDDSEVDSDISYGSSDEDY